MVGLEYLPKGESAVKGRFRSFSSIQGVGAYIVRPASRKLNVPPFPFVLVDDSLVVDMGIAPRQEGRVGWGDGLRFDGTPAPGSAYLGSFQREWGNHPPLILHP